MLQFYLSVKEVCLWCKPFGLMKSYSVNADYCRQQRFKNSCWEQKQGRVRCKTELKQKTKERTVTNMDGEANLKKCTKKNGRKNKTREGQNPGWVFKYIRRWKKTQVRDGGWMRGKHGGLLWFWWPLTVKSNVQKAPMQMNNDASACTHSPLGIWPKLA